MIRVATVFSGIGAIEHALMRMGLASEIVFACDNGDVNPFSRKVTPLPSSLAAELMDLRWLIEKLVGERLISEELISKLAFDIDQAASDSAQYGECLMASVPGALVESVSSLLRRDDLRSAFSAQKTRELEEGLRIINSDPAGADARYVALNAARSVVAATSRLLPDTQSLALSIAETYHQINGPGMLRSGSHLADTISMLHEQANTLQVKFAVDALDSYAGKKAYVDSLYAGKANPVRESYLENYRLDHEHFHWNASFLDGLQYRGKVDLLVGGSPCQSFSLVGKQRGLDDTRGTLFYEFARLIDEVQPAVFVYENVKALLSNDGGETWKTITAVFDSLGYDWSYSLLNARDYGIPQNRERLFAVGFRRDVALNSPFTFPDPVALEKTMQDFLLDNVAEKYYLGAAGVRFVTSAKNLDKRYTQIDGTIQLCQKKNQQFNWHGDFVHETPSLTPVSPSSKYGKYFLSDSVARYVMAPGTKTFVSRPKTDLPVARPLLTTMHKMHRAGVDNYVTSAGKLRKLTPRECLRLMGFCDSFRIVVSDTSMYQQAGNSIVVDVLIALVDSILAALPTLGLRGDPACQIQSSLAKKAM